MNKAKRATGVYLQVGAVLTILSSAMGFGALVTGGESGMVVLVLIVAIVGLISLAVGIYQVGQTVDLIHETLLERRTPTEDPEPPVTDPDHVMGL